MLGVAATGAGGGGFTRTSVLPPLDREVQTYYRIKFYVTTDNTH